jgi:hypothetical protein
VIKVRQHQVVVRLSSWRLAGRSTVTCYLSITAVEVVRSKLYEMSVYERVRFAQNSRRKPPTLPPRITVRREHVRFRRRRGAVRATQIDSSNEVRADLVVLAITTVIMRLLAVQLLHWNEGGNLARNTLIIIDALEPKKGKHSTSL